MDAAGGVVDVVVSLEDAEGEEDEEEGFGLLSVPDFFA